jgi:mutual gliding-motility protein MglA
MVELNQRDRTIKIKIVYYGPPLGGKTTNLSILHAGAHWSQRGELLSVNSAQDRTILFDFMPLKASGFRGFDVRLQLVAVPGQVMYTASRRVALKGTDAVVFVANSAADRWNENLRSHDEMCQYLVGHQIDPGSIPLVFQYNKRDLPDVLPLDRLEEGLNKRRVPSIAAVAAKGEGVLETFTAVLAVAMQDLSLRYRSLELARGQKPGDWAETAIRGIFGKRSLALRPALVEVEEEGIVIEHDIVPESTPAAVPEASALDHRKLKLRPWEATPPSPLAGAQNGVGDDALVEVYAEASTELGVVAAELREERNLAEKRLEEVRRALDVSDELLSGGNVDRALLKALDGLAEAGRCEHASLILPSSRSLFRALTRPPLQADPMLQAPGGLSVLEMFRQDEKPSLVSAAEMSDVAAVLEAAAPPMSAMVVVPLRSPTRLLGFAVLYYPPDTALPSQARLDHLDLLARIVRSPLELAVERGRA